MGLISEFRVQAVQSIVYQEDGDVVSLEALEERAQETNIAQSAL